MNNRSQNDETNVLSESQTVRGKTFGWFARGEWPGWLTLLVLIFLPSAVHAAATNNVDLSEVPLEQLLNMDVTILRGHDTLSKTPAAISIVTADDIRRSGAMNIPEALRQVPGMQVAQLDSSEWAISARGFNDE